MEEWNFNCFSLVEHVFIVDIISKIKNVCRPTEEDPPVQGPLPYEPDDAPWKKSSGSSETGIRKLLVEKFGLTFEHMPLDHSLFFSVFANYFRNQAPRVFHGDHYLHYLKWLSLLALTLTLSESHECSPQTMNLLPSFLIDSSGNSDIWYIK